MAATARLPGNQLLTLGPTSPPPVMKEVASSVLASTGDETDRSLLEHDSFILCREKAGKSGDGKNAVQGEVASRVGRMKKNTTIQTERVDVSGASRNVCSSS